jgi:alkylation response protein AidB-like acyl-CoA dehydrogenase
MNFELSARAAALQQEMRRVLPTLWPHGRRGYRFQESAFDYDEHKRFRLRLAGQGWLGYGIPAGYGGSGGGDEERFVVASEFAYHGVPYPKCALNIVVPMLRVFGSEEMKGRIFPLVARGEMEFSLAYTEPEAGTDLASLRTTAVRRGDSYVIRGQKLYSSFVHRSELCLVAVRTSASAEKHEGISLLLVPVDSPGMEQRPLWGMGDIRTNVVFFDDVAVPAQNLVGGEGQGWACLRAALAQERLASFSVSHLRPVFDDLVDYLGAEPGAPFWRDGGARYELAQQYAELQALEALTFHALWLLTSGADASAASAQVKVVGTELRQRLARLALRAVGPAAQCIETGEQAGFAGSLYRWCEGAVMPTFGGGANEVLRDLIGKARLGLQPSR